MNEEATVAKVVAEISDALPEAQVYVYDNASTDRTFELAQQAGAEVLTEPIPGKGNVVRRMFADIEADVYVIIDGDATYDPTQATVMVKQLVEDDLDMVVGVRSSVSESQIRTGHTLGNRLFNRLYKSLFGSEFSDILSGYRVFSKRFVKTFPAVSSGFEIETEMSVHASQLGLPVSEIPVNYMSRPEGSQSKLRTIKDGYRIFKAMIALLKENRPLLMFGWLSTLSLIAAGSLGIPLLVTFVQTGLVPKLPTAVLATGFTLLALLFTATGLILHSIAKGRIEIKRLAYLHHGTSK
jgi:glycosyltransferase involved in cell wall biosynthesis